MGQPTNLTQLKKRMTVGAAFEIMRPGIETEQRRVIIAQSANICSIVPFDTDHRINKCGGSWLNWGKAAYWRFENGFCSIYYTQTDEAQTESNLILSIRVLDTTAEEDEQYNTWLADLKAQHTAEQDKKESERMAQEHEKQKKQAQEIEDALTAAETAIFERGKRINNDDIHSKCIVLRLAERYNITVPLRTAGWISKNLKYFIVDTGNTQATGIRVWSTKKTPQGVCDVLFAILHAVDAHFEDITVNSSVDNAQSIDTVDSSGVSAAGNGAIHVSSVSDAYKPIYSEYTQNLAGGHNTALPLNTS